VSDRFERIFPYILHVERTNELLVIAVFPSTDNDELDMDEPLDPFQSFRETLPSTSSHDSTLPSTQSRHPISSSSDIDMNGTVTSKNELSPFAAVSSGDHGPLRKIPNNISSGTSSLNDSKMEQDTRVKLTPAHSNPLQIFSTSKPEASSFALPTRVGRSELDSKVQTINKANRSVSLQF
jgi:hypothetical protein